ncbi:Nca2p [Malassezia vespertilionis]|uniref:Nca2p n=1 Tax=Malassezia vespertilionis TaxID=2020962 RepID=A0A2N1J7Y9_9BASI|nr:Nca2p [Malassezia vespertilionis]
MPIPLEADAPLGASLRAAIEALPPPSKSTLDGETLLRLRTCSAFGSALARVQSTQHTEADLDRIVYAAYAYMVDQLILTTSIVNDAQWYWLHIEQEPLSAGLYWLQTIPHRVAGALYSVTQRGLRVHGASVLHPLQTMHLHARTRIRRLQQAHVDVASLLGALGLAWRAEKGTAYLCTSACTALGAPAPRGNGCAAVARLLDAMAQHEMRLARLVSSSECGVPSTLTRIWPMLLLYPLVSAGITRYVTHHWDSLWAQVGALGETVRGLVVGWVWEPAMQILDTLRAGQAERRMIISRDSLQADQRSLERMVAGLAQDKLRLDTPGIQAVVRRVQDGDLTEVMELYEKSIRAPFRALMQGNLVRTLLIQVQKAKVDLEIALSGIDWLLRSQELLIGFLGLAPAIGLVYMLGRQVFATVHTLLWGGETYRAKRTLRLARIQAWEALRRLDKIVSERASAVAAQPALQYGYLLLDVATLRSASTEAIFGTCGAERALATQLQLQMNSDLIELEVMRTPGGSARV